MFVFPLKARYSSFRWTLSDICRVFALSPPERLTAEVKLDEVLIASGLYCKESEIFLSYLPLPLISTGKEKSPEESGLE